ncbi:aminopeptidase P family protein [bacterium]|nr:aminopeptidase P family protein [bacterium]
MTKKEDFTPVGRAEYKRRQAKAARMIREMGFSGFVAAGPSNQAYFTGARGGYSDRLYATVIAADGEVFHVCPAFEEGRMREQWGSDADIVTWQEDEDPVKLISHRLSGLKGPVGIEDTMPLWYFSAFNARCRQGAVDASCVTRVLRSIKSKKELELLEGSNRIIGEAVKAAFETAREGMTNLEMSEAVKEACQERGVRGSGFVLFGEAASFPHGTKLPQKLKKGDIMLCDAGCDLYGYISDITRSVVFGTPNRKQKEIFKILREAQDAAREAAKAGNELGAPDLAARKVIGKGGYGYDYENFTHRLGHGIGLDGHEWPYLCRGKNVVLKKNMTFSNEPGIYIPGVLGMRLEDCMHIGEKGGEFFASRQKSLEEI